MKLDLPHYRLNSPPRSLCSPSIVYMSYPVSALRNSHTTSALRVRCPASCPFFVSPSRAVSALRVRFPCLFSVSVLHVRSSCPFSISVCLVHFPCPFSVSVFCVRSSCPRSGPCFKTESASLRLDASHGVCDAARCSPHHYMAEVRGSAAPVVTSDQNAATLRLRTTRTSLTDNICTATGPRNEVT